MTRDERQLSSRLLLLLILCGGALLVYSWLARSRQAAIGAAADLRAAQDLAVKIEALRGKPSVIGAEGPENELRRRIADAAQAAEIPANSLGSIEGRPPRRLDNSAYQERPTQVALRDVSLRQVIQFCHALSENGLRFAEIRLSASPRSEGDERWAAETVLSYLVYSPKGKPSKGAADIGN